MKSRKSILTAVVLLLSGGYASADERPAFEQYGLPISLHQLQVMGADHVVESLPVSTPTLEGLPASPHQMSVLKSKTAVVVTNGFGKTAD